jgi:hypothetical protein
MKTYGIYIVSSPSHYFVLVSYDGSYNAGYKNLTSFDKTFLKKLKKKIFTYNLKYKILKITFTFMVHYNTFSSKK